MAHNLATLNGQTAMMFTGEPPWHGLGTRLDKPATAAEAIRAAQLDWEVTKTPLFITSGSRLHEVRDKFAVVRKDQLASGVAPPVLGIVGREYTPLQNREAFDWFDPIVGEGAAIYHTAGALGEGERVWILAKLPDTIQVVGHDITDKYLLLSNSHDGGSSVQVKFTPIRVVCQNTLTMALSGGRGIRIQHTPTLRERLAAARDALGIIRTRFDEIAESFRGLAKVQVAQPRLDDYLGRVFPWPADREDKRAMARVERARAESGRLFEEGRGNREPGVRGTLWAAYNGVTEYVDYVMSYRDGDRHLDAIWFGSGYLAKARAYRVAVQSAAAWRN
jgi:phage/plasmid-like protein (TIGR03299 family)